MKTVANADSLKKLILLLELYKPNCRSPDWGVYLHEKEVFERNIGMKALTIATLQNAGNKKTTLK